MNRNYIVGVVIIGVALYAGFLFGQKSATAPTQDVATTDSTTPQAINVATTSTAKPAVPKKTTTKTTQTGTAKITTSVAVTAPTMTKDGSYIVYYTASGFTPPAIEIKVGKAVHFVNDSNKAMSITSMEPNIQSYGELNQGKTVGRGGTYDFMFLKAGAWKYMNRNNPLDTGVIVVK